MPLFEAKSSPEPAVPSEMLVDVPEEGLLRIRFYGCVDGPLVKKGIVRVREQLGKRRCRVFLADTMEVTRIDASMRAPGLDLLAVMKENGITACFASASSSVVRLIATTLGMASGLRMELLATTDLALKRAQATLRGVKA